MAGRGLLQEKAGESRCWWAGSDGLYRDYHDHEWGQPASDDIRLFEKICLEGFQSGLSWLTILRKRENFRRAFRDFDFEAVSRFRAPSVERLLRDPGIVRHRGKIEATLHNARRAVALADEFGSLASYFWRFEPDPSTRPRRITHAWLMANPTSRESEALSRDLKQRGWRFVGPTTAYAFMQAMGLVNDHVEGCAARPRTESRRDRFPRPAGVAFSS